MIRDQSLKAGESCKLEAAVQDNPMKTTPYFEFSVRRRRPHLKDEWIETALLQPEYTEIQPNGRIRHYVYIEE